MNVTAIINLLRKSVSLKTYDFVPTEKNRNTRRKYGLTIEDLEYLLLSISEKDLHSGPLVDRDKPGEELFIFKKRVLKNVVFYIKIKKDNYLGRDRIKILSCHEDER